MVQTAKVTRILDDGRAEVAVKRQSACAHDCSQCGGGCSEMMVSPTVAVVAENPVHAMPGDTVTLESATGRVLRVAALVYLVPFVLFFVLYLLVISLGAPEGGGIAAGFCGFAAGLLLAVAADRHMRRQRGITFRITAIDTAP
jgi:sigma-E factor negative regulatory protein RseC